MRRFLCTTALLLLLASAATAGEFNQVLDVGDDAPAWKELPGIDGKKHSLADLKGKDVVIVTFTCNSCPIAVDYEDRIIALAEKYAGPEGRAALVAINVNKIEEDSLPNMKKRAEEKKFPFTYLFDETQQIAKDFGARYTPEFFVLDRDRKVVYMGGMDDSSDPDQVKNNYLTPAVEAALAGKQPEVGEFPPRGCTIRYVRERRKKQ